MHSYDKKNLTISGIMVCCRSRGIKIGQRNRQLDNDTANQKNQIMRN